MPTEPSESVIHRLAAGDAVTVAEVVREFESSGDAGALVAVALFADDSTALMSRAAGAATTTRDRQLVAIADAYLAHDMDRVDVLARDHLVDHPDSVLVAWIAAAAQSDSPTRKDHS